MTSRAETRPSIVPADEAGIARAADLLKRGGLVALPTETVYGLAARASDGAAVARIFAAKARPRFNPLIVHLPDLHAVDRHVALPPAARTLVDRHWPGPLTLVAPKRPTAPVADLASAGLDTLAVRVPAHPVTRAVLRALGEGVVAPSANRSGRTSPTTAEHVAEDLKADVDLILDGGPCRHGLESTIIGFLGDGAPRMLRPGAIARAEIEDVLGPLAGATGAVAAPGMTTKHYAPQTPIRLNARKPETGEAFLAFGDAPPHDGAVANLSPTQDLAEAATNLFAMMRMLDAAGAARIAVAPIPETGLGEAINDRLRRAAAP